MGNIFDVMDSLLVPCRMCEENWTTVLREYCQQCIDLQEEDDEYV
jgi:hypothetical protein